MRLLGVLEVSSGWHFDALHVRGIHDGVADGILRWDRDSVLVNLRAVHPDVPWQMRGLGDAGKVLCTSVLASNSYGSPLRPRLNALVRGILAHGWTFGYVNVLVFLQSCSDGLSNVVAVVRVCGVLFRYQEIAVGHHQKPFVCDQVFPSDFARFRA